MSVSMDKGGWFSETKLVFFHNTQVSPQQRKYVKNRRFFNEQNHVHKSILATWGTIRIFQYASLEHRFVRRD